MGGHFHVYISNAWKNQLTPKKTATCQTHFGFTNIAWEMNSFRPRVIWNKKFRFGSPCNCRKVLIKWLYFDPCRYVLKILVQRNRLDLVEDLLDNGADVTQHGGWKRWERNAVMNNQTFCLAFVEHFDVFLKLFHRTGLHVALHFDYLDIAKILVDSDTSKISLNTQDNDGR